LERATAGQSAEEEEALQDVYDARGDAFGGALRGVMLAAAPDFAAFASKLELFFEPELEPNSVDGDVLAAIRGDAARPMEGTVTSAECGATGRHGVNP
jgi:hypothetical protein